MGFRLRVLPKLLLERGVMVYFRIRSSWPLWFYVLNRKPRRLLRENPPRLDAVQARVVRELKETGIAVSHVEEFFPEEKILLEGLQRYTQTLRGEAAIKTPKAFLAFLWDPAPQLDFRNPFLALALSSRVLDVVNSYLGMFSRFYFFTLNATQPVNSGEERRSSQRWHRDPEDKKLLKMFLYLTDVDVGSGPFMYVLRSSYGLKWGSLFPSRPPRGFYPDEKKLENIISKDEVKVCKGRAGTIIFCDTAGLHRGGYATGKERLMFTAGYYSPASPFAPLIRRPENFEKEGRAEKLPFVSRYALGQNFNPISAFVLYKFKELFRKKNRLQKSGLMDER